MVQWVKDPAFPLLWLRSLFGAGLILGPRKFFMPWVQAKKKKKKD